MLTICHWPGQFWKYLKIISCLTEHTAHMTIMSAYTIFTPMQDKVYSTNLALKCMKSSEIHIWSAKPDCSDPDQQSQTKACITKSCEVCALLRYYTVQSGNSALMFQDNLSVPKKEQSLREDNWHNLLFWDLVHCLISQTCTEFWKPVPFPSSGKEVPNLVGPLD